MSEPNNNLVKLSQYHILIIVFFLLFFLVTFLAGVLLLVTGKGQDVWKLLLCGGLGLWLSIKVISIKYAKQ